MQKDDFITYDLQPTTGDGDGTTDDRQDSWTD
jgi:hypothetical protein